MGPSRKSNPLLNVVVFLIFVLDLFISILGFSSLLSSPYTGMTVKSRSGRAVVTDVDTGSPARMAGIMINDALLDINDVAVPAVAFVYEANHLSSRREQRAFWEAEKKLFALLTVGKPVRLIVERGGVQSSISLIPAVFPFREALGRTLPISAVGWACFIVAYLVLRKKYNEITIVNLIFWAAGGLISISFPYYILRDLVYPPYPFLILAWCSYLGLIISSFACIHLTLVFPRRKKVLAGRPWLIPGIYLVLGLVILAEAARIFDYAHVTTYIPIVAGLTLFALKLVFDFLTERNPVYKKQIQWVIFGFTVGIAWGLVTLISILIHRSLLSAPLATLPTIVFPVSLAIAITRYRLMDIEGLIDQTVVFGFTILVLEGVELAFLSGVSPLLTSAGMMPLASLSGVLLIVFLYLPVRNKAKKIVERLFKRGDYDGEKELQTFIIGLGVCDNGSALAKFTSFIQGLLSPETVRILEKQNGGATVVIRQDGKATEGESVLLGDGQKLWDYFTANRQAAMGFELADKDSLAAQAAPGSPLESALFVPLFGEDRVRFLAVLFPKKSGRAYSHKDRAMLDAVSSSMVHIIAAEENSARLERERLRIAREIHDGISSEFTGIICYSEKGETLAANGGDGEVKDLLARIAGSARRGIQELRAVIWALNPERQTLGYLAAYAKTRVADLLEAAGIRVAFNEIAPGDDVPVRPHIALAAHRIVQELSHNTVKHSGAGAVRIAFRMDDAWLELEYSDDGKGFDVEAALRGNGNGLKNIKKRMEEAGGSIRFESSPGAGFAVRARLPR
jgi:signal transduction histidine kinase